MEKRVEARVEERVEQHVETHAEVRAEERVEEHVKLLISSHHVQVVLRQRVAGESGRRELKIQQAGKDRQQSSHKAAGKAGDAGRKSPLPARRSWLCSFEI